MVTCRQALLWYQGFDNPKEPSLPFIYSDLFWARLVHSECKDAPHPGTILGELLCFCIIFYANGQLNISVKLWPKCWSVVMAPDYRCPCLPNKNPSMLCYMLRFLWIQRQSELPSKKCWAMESLLIPDPFGGIEYVLALGFTASLDIVQKAGTYHLKLLLSSFLNRKVGKLPFG